MGLFYSFTHIKKQQLQVLFTDKRSSEQFVDYLVYFYRSKYYTLITRLINVNRA